jgi:hypothetical protein
MFLPALAILALVIVMQRRRANAPGAARPARA